MTTLLDPATLPQPLARYYGVRSGPGQLCQFVATAEGIKPVMDDWIRADHLDELRVLADEFDLSITVDEQFNFVPEDVDLAEVVGGDLLNTTRAHAEQPGSVNGLLHVYLGRKQGDIIEASRAGWYNLIAGGRVVPKPWIDHYWFGQLLGYPDCCLKAFARHGAWNTANPYAAAHGATVGTPLAVTNPAHRHAGLAYVVHYPCSFDCDASAELGERVRRAVDAWSPALRLLVDRTISGPHLLLSGWVAYGFTEATVGDTSTQYGSVVPAPTNQPDSEFTRLLQSGNRAEVRGDVVLVWSDDELVGTRQVRADRYAPEHAVLLDFAFGAEK